MPPKQPASPAQHAAHPEEDSAEATIRRTPPRAPPVPGRSDGSGSSDAAAATEAAATAHKRGPRGQVVEDSGFNLHLDNSLSSNRDGAPTAAQAAQPIDYIPVAAPSLNGSTAPGFQTAPAANAPAPSPAGSPCISATNFAHLPLQQAEPGGGGAEERVAAAGEAQTWLIVEYCDGGTLADVCKQGQLLLPDGAPHMAKILVRLHEVAAGMSYLHNRSVLHGDLKAANVMLASKPGGAFGMVCKVSDFGLSRVLNAGATHRSTGTLGTITHQPPELLRLGKMSPAGDVYAFGILMW